MNRTTAFYMYRILIAHLVLIAARLPEDEIVARPRAD